MLLVALLHDWVAVLVAPIARELWTFELLNFIAGCEYRDLAPLCCLVSYEWYLHIQLVYKVYDLKLIKFILIKFNIIVIV